MTILQQFVPKYQFWIVVRVATFVALVIRVTAASKSASNMSTVILMTIVTKAVTEFVTLVSVPDVNDPARTSSMTAMTEEMFVKIP